MNNFRVTDLRKGLQVWGWKLSNLTFRTEISLGFLLREKKVLDVNILPFSQSASPPENSLGWALWLQATNKVLPEHPYQPAWSSSIISIMETILFTRWKICQTNLCCCRDTCSWRGLVVGFALNLTHWWEEMRTWRMGKMNPNSVSVGETCCLL